jgi:hypothetical protein
MNRVGGEPMEYCTGQEVPYKEHNIDAHYFDAVSINMIYIFQAVFCPTVRWFRTST